MIRNENGECLIEHHIKYLEIHGVDKTVWMTESEHRTLHNRLRNEGKCNVPSDVLNKISKDASSRTEKTKEYKKKYSNLNMFHKSFSKSIAANIRHRTQIHYNLLTGYVGIYCGFEGYNGVKLHWIGDNGGAGMRRPQSMIETGVL